MNSAQMQRLMVEGVPMLSVLTDLNQESAKGMTDEQVRRSCGRWGVRDWKRSSIWWRRDGVCYRLYLPIVTSPCPLS